MAVAAALRCEVRAYSARDGRTIFFRRPLTAFDAMAVQCVIAAQFERPAYQQIIVQGRCPPSFEALLLSAIEACVREATAPRVEIVWWGPRL